MTFPKARPTTYKSVDMRSRLEAKFAEFLDGMDYSWNYEPRAYAGDGGQYLPDFEVTAAGSLRVFVETKPTLEAAYAVMPRMEIIWQSLPTAMLIIAVAHGPMFFAGGIEPDGSAMDHVWRPTTIPGWTDR